MDQYHINDSQAGRDKKRIRCITESIMDVVVECVPVTVVGEAIVVGGELLQCLQGDRGEVAGDLGVVR